MQPENQPETPHNPIWMSCLGWLISILPALALIASGGFKIAIAMKKIEPPPGQPDIGWSESSMLGLAILEIGSAVLYLFPRTAVLGAILVTGYLGGAIATHVRIHDPFYYVIIFGVLIWFGLLLRDERVRELLPWRRLSTTGAPTGGFLAGFLKFLLVLVVIVGLIVGLAAAQPTEYRIVCTTTIDAPPAKVFEQVNDFHKWKAWSPWDKMEPDAKNTFSGPESGTGAGFKWEGQKLGEGGMIITDSKPNEYVKIKLDFVKPYPDSSNVEFTFKPKEDKTVVTWIMAGERDFKGKVIGLALDIMLRGSFNDGLAEMKKVAEAK